MEFRDDVPCARDSLSIYGASLTQFRGVPAKETRRDFAENGSTFSQDADRCDDGTSVITKFQLNERYRRDSTGDDKKREERAAVAQILGEYNSLHSTDYSDPQSDSDDRDVDVIVKSPSGHTCLRVQVVTADRSIWRKLACDGALDETISEDDLISRLAKALECKRTRADPGIVLVLDGPWAMTPGTIDRFCEEKAGLLAEIRFEEVWYSERGPRNYVRRLR